MEGSTPIFDLTTHASILRVAGLAGTITKVTLTLNITHAWDGDISASLVSPTGTTVALFTNTGQSGQNFAKTTFDDQAITTIGNGAAPFNGSYIPLNPLSAFNGQNANGTWKLLVSNNGAGHRGTLYGWSLSITTAEPSTVTDAAGHYSFTNFPAGTYTVRELVPAEQV